MQDEAYVHALESEREQLNKRFASLLGDFEALKKSNTRMSKIVAAV